MSIKVYLTLLLWAGTLKSVYLSLYISPKMHLYKFTL